jgi:phosphate transport system permease protein
VQADRVFRAVCYAAGGITVAIMLAVGVFLSGRAGEALARSGPAFLWTQAWSPEGGDGQFGIAASATVTIAFIALSIALPLSLATALLISEWCPGASDPRSSPSWI